ncbi:MAG: glycosyltransferase family 2 protein, partial [Verrucomicrobiota bacterium]
MSEEAQPDPLTVLRRRVEELERENIAMRKFKQELFAKNSGGGTHFLCASQAEAKEVKLKLDSRSRKGVISVVIPVYNGGHFLERAVKSILDQELPLKQIQILICEDGSTDNSLHKAKDLAERHPSCVQLCTHPNNGHRGISATRNLGFEHATGEYIALLDVDDIFHKKRLARVLAVFEREPRVQFLTSLGRNVDKQLKPVKGWNGFELAGDYEGAPQDDRY